MHPQLSMILFELDRPIPYENRQTTLPRTPIKSHQSWNPSPISVERSRELARTLEKLGLDYWYVEIAGAPHTFDLQPPQMDIRPVLLTFLATHLGAPDTSDR
jgi:hypothetical protein